MNDEIDTIDPIDLDRELREMLLAREGPETPQPRVRRSRRWIAVPLAAAIATAAMAVVVLTQGGRNHHDVTASSGAQCAAALEWHGATYTGTRVPHPLSFDGGLGEGTLPACGDNPGEGGRAATRTSLVAVAGVSPEQAVAIAGDSATLYVAYGYFPQQPGTALHRALYGNRPGLPDERENDCANTKLQTVEATVSTARLGILRVKLADGGDLPRETFIFPDARTIIIADGDPPHVRPGDTVRADVLVCRHPNDKRFLKLVATKLAIAKRVIADATG
ncbi:MAG TPA: DUF6281 family protein [Gaiellaceae bacterium]|nr:DUF6281 family protein [Gaiellaceae bacterium]